MLLTLYQLPYEKMVWIAYRAEKLDQAKELIQSALSSDSENLMLWRSSGLIHLLKEDYPLAIKNFQRSLKLNVNQKTTHFLLGYSFSGLLEQNKGQFDSESELLSSAQDEFQKASGMPLLKEDSDFKEGMKLLNEKSLSESLGKMELVLKRLKDLQIEPPIFSNLALSFLSDEKKVDQNQVRAVINELEKRSEQGKEYPEINNHLGLCFLIFWRNLFLEAQNHLSLAVKKDAKFQKAKTNLIFLESSEKKISALIRELKF